MNSQILLLPILMPFVVGILTFVIPKKWCNIFVLFTSAINFIIAILLFKKELILKSDWLGFGIDFILRLYNFSSFIILFVSLFALIIAIYCLGFLKTKVKQFYAYLLITLALVNGAVLSDNLVLLLFFWEGLLLTLYAMISLGTKEAFKTSTKAFIIVGASDICMMAGIALVGYLAGSFSISKINLPLNTLSSIAFVLLIIGAISKSGCMPFHSWIPDAAADAPLGFMAFVPAAIEKLLGIYFLTRITLDMFKLTSQSALSAMLMVVGVITIIFAVMMALVQKDYKKLLSYHAISQVGYMVLGIGTCLPAGIIGGIFHMLNNALYKCGLFLTAGAVENSTQTTDLNKLGALRRKMPVTFLCFIIVSASICGVPPFNGFFSKELIYEATLKRGGIFYLAAIIGSFLTVLSFLKLGHAVFMGEARNEYKEVKEAPISMLLAMATLALICITFGILNYIPINNFIRPVVTSSQENFGHINLILASITLLVLLLAFIHHYIFAKIKGSGLKAVDHIHNAPVLSIIYHWQERKYLDPYEAARHFIKIISKLFFGFDRLINWICDSFIVRISYAISRGIRHVHAGYYVLYVIWSLVGAGLVMAFIMY